MSWWDSIQGMYQKAAANPDFMARLRARRDEADAELRAREERRRKALALQERMDALRKVTAADRARVHKQQTALRGQWMKGAVASSRIYGSSIDEQYQYMQQLEQLGESALAGLAGAGFNFKEPQAPRNDAEARAWIQREFGDWMWLLNDPEVGNVLMKSAYAGEESDQMMTRLKGTQWWRSRSDAQREYDWLMHTDPGEFERRRQENAAKIGDMVKSLGLTSEINADWFAGFAMRQGFSPEQMMDYLVDTIDMQTVGRPGAAQTIFQGARQTGLDYFLKIDDTSLLNNTKAILKGERSLDDFRASMREQAKKRYAHLAQAIDKGQTLNEYFADARARIAQMLETPYDSIDLVGGRYNAIVSKRDPETGKTREMTQYEIEDLVRSDNRWQYTDNARRQAASLGNAIGSIFGAT